MNGTLRSLRDWLTDQLAEVRHASPLAVLAVENRHAVAPMPETVTKPAERLSAPVGLVSLADMPDVEATPRCEVRTVINGVHACGATPTVIARCAHLIDGNTCALTPVLLCSQHLNRTIIAVAEMLKRGPLTCEFCNQPVRCVRDTVTSVIPL